MFPAGDALGHAVVGHPVGMKASSSTWLLRAVWASFALAPTWTLFDDRSGAVRAVLAGWGWSLWAAGAVALAVVSPWSLTTLRICSPATGAIAVASVVDGGGATAWAGAVAALVATWLVMTTEVCADMVQGAAYGDELRLPLRTPVPHLAPAVVAWLLLVGSTVPGTLLLASRQWVAGSALTALGVLLSFTVPRRLHRLARRWLVFVPAGIVVHDHLVLAESMMVRTASIRGSRGVPAPGEEADLTGGVLGPRWCLELREPEKTVLAPITARILGTTEALHVSSFSVAPRTPRRHRHRLSV